MKNISRKSKKAFSIYIASSSRTWILICLAGLLVITAAWSIYTPGLESSQQTPSPTVQPTVLPPGYVDPQAPRLLPEEWAENYRQTDGIILGGVVMVLVIVGGTLGTIRRKTNKN